MSDLISKQVLELWNRYKPTIAVDAIEYESELKKLLGTNFAEVGTDCISKQKAIEIVEKYFEKIGLNGDICVDGLRQLPTIQPEIVRCKDCQYWNKGSCECSEHAVNCQDYYVGDIETEAEYFCGYAERKEVNNESN